MYRIDERLKVVMVGSDENYNNSVKELLSKKGIDTTICNNIEESAIPLNNGHICAIVDFTNLKDYKEPTIDDIYYVAKILRTKKNVSIFAITNNLEEEHSDSNNVFIRDAPMNYQQIINYLDNCRIKN